MELPNKKIAYPERKTYLSIKHGTNMATFIPGQENNVDVQPPFSFKPVLHQVLVIRGRKPQFSPNSEAHMVKFIVWLKD